MSAFALPYEDLNSYDSFDHYVAPNENVFFWRDLIKHVPIYRAAAICSGGEVGLFSILPLVRKELVLVDHSYRSLSIALTKYMALQRLGAKETKRLITRAPEKDLKEAMSLLRNDLPEPIQQVTATISPRNYWRSGGRVKDWTSDGSYRHSVKEVWDKLPGPLLAKAEQKLNKVKFVHGDFTDLIDKGPFGLIYLSNALGHYNRDRAPLLRAIDQVQKVVKPGGYVIACMSNVPKSWEMLEKRECRSPLRWMQALYRVPA